MFGSINMPQAGAAKESKYCHGELDLGRSLAQRVVYGTKISFDVTFFSYDVL